MNPRKVLRGDSKAGITQLSTDAGAWRTRHLRLRAWKLREAIQKEEGAEWTVEHCPGSELSADGFTKSLQSQAFRRFRDFLSMRSRGRERDESCEDDENYIMDETYGKNVGRHCLEVEQHF